MPLSPLVQATLTCALAMPLWGLYTWFSSHKVVRLEQESNTLVIRGLPFVGSIDFALDPYRYIRNLRATFPSSWIRFTICGVHIVLPAGDVAKKVCFTHRSFSFMQGYSMLGPGLQRMFVKNRHSGSHDSAGPFLRQFMRTEAIESQIVPTIKALSETLEQWGESGIIDPFEMYPKIVFRIGLRIALGSEAADDEDTVTYAMHAFRWLNESAQPHSLLFPLIPTPSRVRCWLGSLRIFLLVRRVAAERRTSKTVGQDVLQVVLDDNVDLVTCVQLTAMSTFAASSTTSAMLIWLHVYLIQHPEWHMKVNAEISQFVSRNCPGSSHLTAEALGTIGLSAWESELPILESCIQETVRLVAIGALPRRNTGSDLTVEGHTIRSGDFVLLMTEEANLDEEIYEHPQEFKPDRDLSKAEAKPLASLGWGYGNYACPGQRFAKTLLKVVSVLLLPRFDCEIIDTKGQPYAGVPDIERDLFSIGLPLQKVRIHYSRRISSNASPAHNDGPVIVAGADICYAK